MIPATELLPDLERRRLRALVSADMATAAPLHAEDYWLVTPSGSGLTKDRYLGAIASGELGYRVFEPVSEITVLAGADLAVLRYRARISFDDGPGFVCWHTDCYRRGGETWQVVWSQATAITPAASGAGPETGSASSAPGPVTLTDRTVYFGGDPLSIPELGELPDRFGHVDLAPYPDPSRN